MDVGGGDAGHGEGGRAGPGGTGEGEVDLAGGLALERFAGAEDADEGAGEGFCGGGGGDDEGAAAVADDAAVESVEGVGDHGGGEDVVDGDDVAEHGVGVVLGVVAGGDLDPGELFAGGSELVHVAHGAEAVHVGGDGSEGGFPGGIGDGGEDGAGVGAGVSFAAGAAGEGDEGDLAAASGDGFGGVGDVGDVAAAADVGAVEVAEAEVHVVGHGEGAEAGGVAGAEVAVDVVLGEPGVVEGADGGFGVELGDGFVGGLAGGVLVGTDDAGLAFDAHGRSLGGGGGRGKFGRALPSTGIYAAIARRVSEAPRGWEGEMESDRRPIAARGLRPVVAVADWLVRRGASPDAISVAGMVAALGAGGAFALVPQVANGVWALWLGGALLVQARLMANLLDGMVAIGRGVASPIGELFNEVPDRVSDTAVLAGLGYAAGSPALGVLAGLAAMATAYVRGVGRGLGVGSDFSGPMAKQHRMAVVTGVAVGCAVLPGGWTGRWAEVALWVVVGGATVTAGRRLARIAGRLRSGVPT